MDDSAHIGVALRLKAYRTAAMRTTHTSRMAVWLSEKFPTICKYCLSVWARYYHSSSKKPHWLLVHLTDRLRYRIPIRLQLGNGMQITVSWRDFIGEQIRQAGFFEIDTVNVINKLLVPGMVFVDAGAHVGQYTLLASQLVGCTGEVHSFEPDPETFKFLTQNVEINRIENVLLNEVALCDEIGKKPLFLSGLNNPGANSLVRQSKHSSSGVCEVEVTTLDYYVRATHITRVDLIKIDVEGAEIGLLRGAASVIAELNPAIIVEFNYASQLASKSSCEILAANLKELDYSLYRVSTFPLREFRLDEGGAGIFNVLALPRRSGKRLQEPMRELWSNLPCTS